MNRFSKLGGLAAAAFALMLSGCETLTVPDFNNPGVDELTENPTQSGVAIAAQGLMVGARNGIGARAGYVSELGILGRESYNFDPSDPRFVTAMLQGPLDPGGNAFGGAHWVFRYQNIRNANILLDAVDQCCTVGTFSDAEKEAIRGWAKTIQALDFLLVINTRDDFGAPIAVNLEDPTAEPAPIASRAEVFQHILDLLDEADSHLASGSAAFPFQLSSGFASFGTPALFRQVNRALKARVLVYRATLEGTNADFTAALSLLNGGDTFLDDSPNIDLNGLNAGVYHSYSTQSGDVTLAIFDGSNQVIVAHPSIVADAQAGDERVDRKIRTVATVTDQASLSPAVTTDFAFSIYTSPSASVPIIRNEELILLRAEANMGAGNSAAALADINLIRTQSGGLAPISATAWAAMSATEQLDELLYNRRYSLLFEGGHRWIDMRRYDRLGQLPVDHPSFVRFSQFPFPQRECDPRSPQPDGCTALTGF